MVDWLVDVVVVVEFYWIFDCWLGDRDGLVVIVVWFFIDFFFFLFLERGLGYVVVVWGDLVFVGVYFFLNCFF